MGENKSFDWTEVRGACPHKLSESLTCYGEPATGPIICNCYFPDWRRNCDRFYRLCDLRDLMPELWEIDSVCCDEYRFLMLNCAEDSGCMAGAVDILKYPNDNKIVWRNVRRIKFKYCPFCGRLARR